MNCPIDGVVEPPVPYCIPLRMITTLLWNNYLFRTFTIFFCGCVWYMHIHDKSLADVNGPLARELLGPYNLYHECIE